MHQVSGLLREPCEPPPSPFVMPDPAATEPGNDLVARGADLAPGTLLAAYRRGLFPMPVDPGRRRSKIAWYSPDPRGVLPLEGLKVSRSLRRSCARYEVRFNTRFDDVIDACSGLERSGHWITPDFADAYREMFRLGWAHSVETYRDDQLVGGLYGLRISGLFAGESMFHLADDASKVALVALVDHLRDTGATLLDTQWVTPHLESLGAISVTRKRYLELLQIAVAQPTA